MEMFKHPIYVTQPLTPNISEVTKEIEKVIESKWLTNFGNKHELLAEELKNYLEVDHLSLFNNGTMALTLGLKALELTGEVITTPFTFPATVQALDWNNLTPVFCDIEEHSLNIDPDKIEEKITDKTTAILAVHVFGNPCNVQKIQQIADKYDLKVIYDGAHAFGAQYKGEPIGNFGDMTMFSFHATKLFNTIEGGALVYSDELYSEKLGMLVNFGLSSPEKVEVSGFNGKMNEIQAVIGLGNLRVLEEERTNRERIRQSYVDEISKIPGIRIITNRKNRESSYQYFVIEINEDEFGISRDELYYGLKSYNIFARRYFYPLCSEFPWYRNLDSAKRGNLPIAWEKVNQVLTLPFYGDLENEKIKIICDAIKEIQFKNVL
ncbi:DegT/DnrJ/EryC1/StrS family aminotransferase [Gracilibacillus thailandensis]|uniref:DegT/DnrJ/EryC1/StrS family aminotransferase n=1 Tax=Gracilibacillus thailandensis TaxID=563735 RepID=A0A6N7R1D6_9BACI|nr:DegT/DnrJ/EryC1/StrS family aminotransferase [Gracilibacillus thailandensis]MRI67031.1 DegT/DnrJ/EryC1/StrS family aminotransferase [Gracilibacillus thailandensis]